MASRDTDTTGQGTSAATLEANGPLDQALRFATRERLETTLRTLCTTASVQELVAAQLLHTPLAAIDGNAQSNAGDKRARPRYQVCSQCKEEFDETLNDEDSCAWHDGELKVDDSEDFWADHDEDCHGEIDTDEMREEFPEGFKWDCCNEKGDSDEYCEIGRHVAKADASASLKRAKV